jgi:hypothetical protein
MASADCGCGCGGAATTSSSAFVRPRFFAGQLLTEDDLSLLTSYVAGKSRLHNRMLWGPGVVSGLEVGCDPCGGGKVVVQPGYALDCAGNDVVVPCAEHVDVSALVHDLRVSSIGEDCGEGCRDDGSRRYGLFVRYEELSGDPVAPYATEEPCATPGCVPSRVRETHRFLVKHEEVEDHRYNPGTRLLSLLGDAGGFGDVQRRARRLEFYAAPLVGASHGPSQGRAVRFTAADARRFGESLARLSALGGTTGPVPSTREVTEDIRSLAGAVARYDTHDEAGRQRLRTEFPDLAGVDGARPVLRRACEHVSGGDFDGVWPDPLVRSLARAVVDETLARVASDAADPDAPLELRMLAQGTPLSRALQAELRTDLAHLREWLLRRTESSAALTDCSTRGEVARTEVPPPLAPSERPATDRVTLAELQQLAAATSGLVSAFRGFVADCACSTLAPPAQDHTDTDVLLAHLELDDCEVTRVCFATREQVLPGGSAYGEWLPKLYRLRELAERLCCQPRPGYPAPVPGERDDITLPHVANLLGEWAQTGDLEQMLTLLLTPAPGETPPKQLHEQVVVVPSEVADGLEELAVLRARVSDLTAALDGLREQLGSARDEVGRVRDRVGDLPERIGPRLAELEQGQEPEQEPEKSSGQSGGQAAQRKPRQSRARKPQSGESS